MSTDRMKLCTQISIIRQQIDSLNVCRLTNTVRRQQDYRNRQAKIALFKMQLTFLEYAENKLRTEELNDFEAALCIGTFFSEIHRLYRIYTGDSVSGPVSFEDIGAGHIKRFNTLGVTDSKTLLQLLKKFNNTFVPRLVENDTQGKNLEELIFTARLLQGGDIQFTPESVVEEMLDMLHAGYRSAILEPSAGIGSIADKLKQDYATVDCIEKSVNFVEILRMKGHNVVGYDFLAHNRAAFYDAIVMNPPFSNETNHIEHAYSLLKIGGELVSVCSVNVGTIGYRKYRQFNEWLFSKGCRIYPLQGNFEGTSVNSQLLYMKRCA